MGKAPDRASPLLTNTVAPLESEMEGMVEGTFSDRASVARAIEELINAHFDPDDDLRVVVTVGDRRREVPVAFQSGASFGAALGAVICLVLGAITAVLMATGKIPGPNSVADDTPWFAGIKGALAGGASGYLLGMVMGLGFWNYRVAFDSSTPEADAISVGVRAMGTRSAEARTIMERAGARHFEG